MMVDLPPKKANIKLQPSPSSASSYSNNSSLFRDDGFEDDFVSTASDRTSTYQSSASSSTRASQQSNQRFTGRHHLLRRSYHQYHSSTPRCSLPAPKPLNLATKNNEPGYLDSNLSISQRVVTEIIETERTYVNDLEQIVTGYICFLRNVLKQQKQSQIIGSKASHLTSMNKHQQQHSQATTTSNNNNKNDTKRTATPTSLTTNDSGVMVNYDSKSLIAFDDNLTSVTHADNVDEVDDESEDGDDEDDVRVDRHNHSQNYVDENDDGEDSPDEHDDQDDESEDDDDDDDDDDEREIKLDNNKCCDEDGAIMTANHIEKLFSNLEDIYKYNKDLLFRLEECYLDPSSVAECFVENSAGFDVYTHYCTTYPIVVSTLTELMANPRSAQLLKERQEKLGQSLPLGAYLLKPVQRILKYHILFQSLITHTANEEIIEKDRQVISEAFSVMSNIAGHINSMKRRHEHAIRVQEVQGLLTGWRGPDLTTLGELILEDSFKLFDRPKSSRHLFLFDNVLLITKKKRDGSLAYKVHIECPNLMLIENIKGQPLVFETVPFDNPKALCAFQARNLDKKRDWCLQMKEVIIKSFDNKIPRHVRDLLMSLTKSTKDTDLTNDTTSDSISRTVKAPNYLEKKNKSKQDKKK